MMYFVNSKVCVVLFFFPGDILRYSEATCGRGHASSFNAVCHKELLDMEPLCVLTGQWFRIETSHSTTISRDRVMGLLYTASKILVILISYNLHPRKKYNGVLVITFNCSLTAMLWLFYSECWYNKVLTIPLSSRLPIMYHSNGT